MANNPESSYREKSDYSSLATILLQIKSGTLYNLANPILINKFDQISADNWIDLLAEFPVQNKNEIISKAIERKNGAMVEKYLTIFQSSIRDKNKSGVEFLVDHFKTLIETYSTIFDIVAKRETNETKSNIVEQTIVILSALKSDELDAVFLHVIIPHVNRNFIHHIATPALLKLKENKFDISKKLTDVCMKKLEERISNKPNTPGDWTRAIPKDNKKGEIWDILIPFLKSPTLEKIEYKKAQVYRQEMENAIRSVNLDLHTQTLKKGTPHTLLITKTFASFEKALKKWHEDCELKNRLLSIVF